jgi:hypothetical protein
MSDRRPRSKAPRQIMSTGTGGQESRSLVLRKEIETLMRGAAWLTIRSVDEPIVSNRAGRPGIALRAEWDGAGQMPAGAELLAASAKEAVAAIDTLQAEASAVLRRIASEPAYSSALYNAIDAK